MGQTISIWRQSFIPETLGKAPYSDDFFDVAIIGAGIGGLTTAYLLASAGLRVVVLERKDVGSGESGRTTAHCATSIDDRYFRMERIHGRASTKLLAESQVEAVDLIEKIISENGILCDSKRVTGYLFAGPGHDVEYLEKEWQAAHRAGLPVEMVAPLRREFSEEKWLAFPNQLQIHPMKYLLGLERAILALGGMILNGAGVTRIHWPKLKEAELQIADGRKVRSRFVVTATNTPFLDRVVMHTKQSAYRTYVIAAKIPRGTLETGFYWDTSDPYHYIRLEGEAGTSEERVIVGGEDHKTGQEESPESRWAALERWARERIPEMGEVTNRWSGQIMEPVDGVAFAGRNPGGHYGSFIITGDSGNGMTNGTIGAKIVSDLITGKKSRYSKLFSPSRKCFHSAGEYLKENLNVALQFTDWLKPGTKKAPVCPHLGAILRWNSAEQSWDCPAHGSRFDARGAILNGPASCPLAKGDF